MKNIFFHLVPIPVDQIVGSSYDVFHKSPAHQRKLLANPANLPHQTQINLGEETLDLLVTAVYDENKEYLGPVVTWSVVTDRLALEKRTLDSKDRLKSTVMGLVTDTGNASEQLAKYITGVVTATEAMVSSIAEISSNTKSAATMTKKTVQEADAVRVIMTDLEKFSNRHH